MKKPRAKKPAPTECQVIKAIQAIKHDVENGDSVSLARKKHCGGNISALYKAVSVHPDYQPIILDYEKKKGYANQYTNRAKNILKGETPRFYQWVITKYGHRVYSINRISTVGFDINSDLIVTTDEDSGKLQLSSKRFEKAIFFQTSELFEDYKKWSLYDEECVHGEVIK